MSNAPIYIFFDGTEFVIHKEETYHQTPDGRFFVELTEPIATLGTSSLSPESVARFQRYLATAREE